MRPLLIAAAAAVLALHAAGATAHGGEKSIGEPGDPARAARTVVVSMKDSMRFDPSAIRVKRGETLRIVARNDGKVVHELVLGTMDGLREHAALMRRFPNMEHDEPNMVRVEPGEKRDIVWRFTIPGEVPFACLQPGHFEAGMVGKVIVGR
ncbi:MAG TPA: cupredoxin family protein [Usitatibacter sp.]|nr:cupredoxin family protein [Usitatibacter sp.]